MRQASLLYTSLQYTVQIVVTSLQVLQYIRQIVGTYKSLTISASYYTFALLTVFFFSNNHRAITLFSLLIVSFLTSQRAITLFSLLLRQSVSYYTFFTVYMYKKNMLQLKIGTKEPSTTLIFTSAVNITDLFQQCIVTSISEQKCCALLYTDKVFCVNNHTSYCQLWAYRKGPRRWDIEQWFMCSIDSLFIQTHAQE